MIRRMDHLCCEDRLRDLGSYNLETRRRQADLIMAFQYLQGAYKKDEDSHLSKACCNRRRGNGFKVKKERFRLDIGRNIFPIGC